MYRRMLSISALLFAGMMLVRGELKPGDEAVGFSLRNVDGKMVSLSDYLDQKGVILVFTCNPCPFARAYEERIIQLNELFAKEGYPVVAINPNDPDISPEDTFEKMVAKATEKDYPFPYLKDEKQAVYTAYGATRTPHIFLLKNENGVFKVAYVGAIDDNAMNATQVNNRYVVKAIGALNAGKKPNPATTKAVGCTIKAKT